MISLIVAMDQNRLIGNNRKLPWVLPADLKRFKELTTGHAVVMGRKTYESIGKSLPNRFNVVLSKRKLNISNGVFARSITDALAACENYPDVFIIGGAEVYAQALESKLCDKMYVTVINGTHFGDVYLPKVNIAEWKEEAREVHETHSFIDYVRV